ncbi:alpha/beta fold hydrolase [Bradyrhizobium sp. CCBAU 51753]|uniref:alpha/beta fold hydrolase n=1 Tax=Bradyrhizobium sp. CCBAU 51753 TaxID=1325100 RepID=UPI001889CE80|nr:alpha/beta hydrolase [Bradyrhizobium sp. CCBAU 51753]QOZ27012.1 alpha/beta hydrolase [Bradyrhizobium sp. CCBAU 51753]
MPRKAAKLVGLSVLGIAAVLIAAAAAGLGYRAWRQQVAAEILAIRSPNGVQEGRYVVLGGIQQWIQIRGEDRGNPVLLFVHGGPGSSTLPISSGWRPWEKYFTVVQWDQRGAGRTYGMTGDTVAPTMTLERMTQDGVELADYLRRHLRKDRIILVGHSWGSFLGVHIVKQRPDLFYAYVGTGQVVGRATFEKAFENTIARLQALAQSANNREALAELAPIAANPVANPDNRLVADRWSKALALPPDAFRPAGPVPPLFMPDFSLLDWYNRRSGTAFSAKYLRGRVSPMFQRDLVALGLEFRVPVILIEGDADDITPSGPAEQYLKQITAPHKEFVPVRGAGHFIPFDRPDQFLDELVARVRPLANPPVAEAGPMATSATP